MKRPNNEEYYVILGVTKEGKKEATPMTVTNKYRKMLDRTDADKVIAKHILKITNADQKYAGYKLARYDTPEAGNKAIGEFLDSPS